MRRLVVVLMLAALASPVLAGQNPDIAIFLNSDSDGQGTNEVCPSYRELFDVYVCFDRFGPGGGLTGVAVRFERTFIGGLVGVHVLQNWGLGFGDIEGDGFAIGAGPEHCAHPGPSGILVVLHVEYLYFEGPGAIAVEEHLIQGNTVPDCGLLLDPWCVASLASHGFSGHFGVCAPPPDARAPDCEPIVTPVEDESWGTIKGLYR